ncbi:MAG: hypothetical protein LBU91_04440, partial [Bacteroidales bacterium]|nr:hypothetical protein [Bacteroidales bacterium]
MVKNLLLYTLFLIGFHAQTLGQASRLKIGDLITNPDGSVEGVVAWINPEETKGYMVALNGIIPLYSVQYGKNTLISEIPQMKGLDTITAMWQALLDMDGYTNTQHLKNYSNCAADSDSAHMVCSVDFDNGWFIPSAGLLNLVMMNWILYIPTIMENGGSGLFDPIGPYWSSTQYSSDSAWTYEGVRQNGFSVRSKTTKLSTIAVKEFTMPPRIALDTTLAYRWNTGGVTTNFI